MDKVFWLNLSNSSNRDSVRHDLATSKNRQIIISSLEYELKKRLKNESISTIVIETSTLHSQTLDICRELKSTSRSKNIPLLLIVDENAEKLPNFTDIETNSDAIVKRPITAYNLSTQINTLLRINKIENRLRIKKRHNKYESIFTNSPLPFHSLNEDGIIIEINQTWLSTLGYSKEEVLDKWYGDFLHPDTQSIFSNNFPILKTCGVVEDVPFLIKKKNGEYIDVSFTGRSRYNDDGSFKQTYCIFQDVTEKKRIEAKAKENAKLLQTMADNYPNSYVSIIEKDLTIGFTSGQEFKNQNLDPKDFIGLNIDQVFRENTKYIQSFYEKTFTGESTSFELHINKQHQFYRTVPLRSENGQIDQILVVAENVTVLRNNEHLIKENEIFLNAIFDSIQNGITVLDKNLTTLMSNNWMKKTFKQTINTPSEKCYRKLYNRDTPCTNCPALKCFKTGNPHVILMPPSKIDHRWIELSAFPIKNEKGKVVNVVEHYNDITAQKQNEFKLIEAKEQAQKSDQLKSKFLESISHEVRTPMNSIMGFSSLLHQENDKETLSTYAKLIESSSEQLLKIINDIVYYARLETEGQLINNEVINIQQFITDIEIQFENLYSNKKIQFLVNSTTGKDQTINTDVHVLDYILTSLIKNAVKYTPHGQISFACTDNKKSIDFSVCDTGIGIPQSDLDHIFDKFYRGSNIDINKKNGTGLGLSIVKKLIDIIGAQIRVKSEIDKGSTFIVSISK